MYAVWKEKHSKPIHEDELIYHIGTDESNQNPICGIHKRFDGNYNSSFNNIENLEEQRSSICKLCLKVLDKKL